MAKKVAKTDSGKGKVTVTKKNTKAPAPAPVEAPKPTPRAEAKSTEPKLKKGFLSSYSGGIVEWQERLKPAREAISLTLYSQLVGASDKLTKLLTHRMNEVVEELTEAKVKIPSDMMTQIERIDAGEEAKVGTKDFTKALSKLKSLCKVVEDAGIKRQIEGEIATAAADAKKAAA
jgi:hypothetical protein